jgi:hypothetical protein
LETHLRDQIVAGINHKELKIQLLSAKNLTYQEARKIVETYHNVHSTLSSSVSPDVLSAMWVAPKRKSQHSSKLDSHSQSTKSHFGSHQHFKSQSPHSQKQHSHSSMKPCDSCGAFHLRSSCKFRMVKCHKCGKTGHIAKVCRSHAASVKLVNDESQESSSENECQAFTVQNSSHLMQSLMFENGKEHQFILDTGSPVNFMPVDVMEQLKLADRCHLVKTTRSIIGVSGHKLPVLGKLSLPVHVEDKRCSLEFLITKKGPSVLGLDGLRRLNIAISLTCSNLHLPLEVENLIVQCSQSRGGIKIEPVHLEVVGEPVFLKARTMAYGLMDVVKKTLDDLVTDGILEPVNCSAWATPIVIALKSNGQPRICGDYKVTINPLLKKTACTTQEIEDMFTSLHGSTIFSKIDLTNAFLQVPLDDKSKEYTTINTKWGLFRYNSLPFGLTVSPGIFQMVIDKVIDGLSGVRAYQDDVIVYGSSTPRT